MTTLEKPKAKEKSSFLKRALLCSFFPLCFFFCETMTHLFYFGPTFDSGLLFIPLVSVILGGIFSAFTFKMSDKTLRTYLLIASFCIGAFYSFMLVYVGCIHTYFSWAVLSVASDVTEYWRETLLGILRNSYKILLVLLPFFATLFFGKKAFARPEKPKKSLLMTGVSVLCSVSVLLCAFTLYPTEFGILKYLRNDLSKSYKTFGAFSSCVGDLVIECTGVPKENIKNPYKDNNVIYDSEKYNVLDIDFEALKADETDEKIAEMHDYFSTVPATKKNSYTGMFKGKNLVFLCAEGFSYKAIDKDRTPTLYKMYTEGFRFNNFYHTLWGGSTATGEYSVLTGNFYHSVSAIERCSQTAQPFCMPALFKKAGYNTLAFHSNVGTYYDRNKAYPNMGFDSFRSTDNGLSLTENLWPRSDLELAQKTEEYYKDSDGPFFAYYMTLSGHANYSWHTNDMSALHRSEYENTTDFSPQTEAYLACQSEVDLAVSDIVNALSQSGKLNDTVFALCCDHYPYGLSDSQLSELYSLKKSGIRSNYELYHNAFILWSPEMQIPIEVDCPCSSYDILPTLANLFGLSYDSRLYAGKDILSDSENIAVINTLAGGGNWNFITDEGSYSTRTGHFKPAHSCTMNKAERREYVKQTKEKIAAMRKYSYAVLENDYYKYITP